MSLLQESSSESSSCESITSSATRNSTTTTNAHKATIPLATITYSIFHPASQDPITLPDDDTFSGDTPTTPKPRNHIRFLSKNVHHISTNSTDDELRMHFGDQQRQERDYFDLVEHKLDTQQYSVRQAFIDNAKTTFRQHKIELGSSELHTVSTYKPGGTAIIAQGNATGRITFQDNDKYGRWSYLHLQGKEDRTISYITVYQVCKKPTNLQSITAYHQQETAFRREQRKNTAPRHNFRHDLIRFITSLQTRDNLIILAGDFNEHILDNNTSLQQISQQCQLVDIW
jgi:hypothetical protein